MSPKEFYERMATLTERELLTLHPGPFAFIATPADALASRLMLWLISEMPPDSTQGDLEEVLQMALWWAQFWNMVRAGDIERQAQATTEAGKE